VQALTPLQIEAFYSELLDHGLPTGRARVIGWSAVIGMPVPERGVSVPR
jgi:hypothetical protein